MITIVLCLFILCALVFLCNNVRVVFLLALVSVFMYQCSNAHAGQEVKELLDCQTLEVKALDDAHGEIERTLCVYRIRIYEHDKQIEMLMWVESMMTDGIARVVNTGYMR